MDQADVQGLAKFVSACLTCSRTGLVTNTVSASAEFSYLIIVCSLNHKKRKGYACQVRLRALRK
eukprot:1157469-Pelagomonas_calceolata.AAC.11